MMLFLGIWMCAILLIPSAVTDLPKPTCENPQLTANNDVIVTCTIRSDFTGHTNCNFMKNSNNDDNFEPVGPQSQSSLSSCSNSPPVSCNIKCTLTLSLYQLGAGVHRFQVSIGIGYVYTSDSDSTSGIGLMYPQVKIVNCPNGENDYIKQGTSATCECERQFGGWPPGRAQWVLPDYTEVGHVVDDTKSILSVTYDPENHNPQLYYCLGVTPLPPENELRETFSPKFAYSSEVISYTVLTPTQQVVVRDGTKRYNSDSSQLEVNASTFVTFVCEGRGGPRPEVIVKSQRSPTPVPSQLSQSGSYKTMAVASKAMACRDTAFYTCHVSNGMRAASIRTILVLVKCTPEMFESTNEPSIYSFINGSSLEIRFEIVGYPDPNKYTLTKSVQRTKRSIDRDDITSDRYNASFKRIDELYGEITLKIYAMTDSDRGHFEFIVQNGIRDGLRYRFYATINEGGSSYDMRPVAVGIVAVLDVSAVIILVAVYRHKKAQPPKRDENEMSENKSDFKARDVRKKRRALPKSPMTEVPVANIEDVDCPPIEIVYEEIDGPAAAFENVISEDSHKGYANWRSQGQRQSSLEEYEHPYNLMKEDAYNTAGPPYEHLDRRPAAYQHIDPNASTSARKEADNHHVTPVSSAPGTKD